MVEELEKLWHYCNDEIFPHCPKNNNELFNQYKYSDHRVDIPGAPDVRKENLCMYFESFKEKPGILILAEAPGPWGCRFSGVPLTSERQLSSHKISKELTFPFSGKISSTENLDPTLEYRRHKRPFTSKTSTIFWKTMVIHHQKFLAWNSLPFHPHDYRDILSFRSPPDDPEVEYYSDFLRNLVGILQPIQFLPLGETARKALNYIGINNFPKDIPHPSKRDNSFKAKMDDVLNDINF
jgi:hypothetical protein